MRQISASVKNAIGHASSWLGLYRQRFATSMTIVAFHRVNDELPEDGITCSSAKFASFCSFFRDHFRVVSLAEQVEACHQGRAMGGTLSITFDDGYLDNFEVAADILTRFELPATFFVTSGFIGTSTVPFWDRNLRKQPGWMNWDHVRSLVSQGFDVGGHTVTHLDLATLDEATVQRELCECKLTLEEEIGKAVESFAYPFGGREHITPRAVDLVRDAGFRSCVSCYGGTNPALADAYDLKRIGIAEWFETPHQFGAELMLGRC